MNSKRIGNERQTNRIGVLLCLLAVTIWSVTALWLHLNEPLDIEAHEITTLLTLAFSGFVLIPLVWFRIQWGYLLSWLLFFGMIVGAIYAILERSFFFSLTLYNLIVIAILIIAGAGVYFSLRAYRESPLPSYKRTLVVFGGAILFIALVAFLGLSNSVAINQYRAVQIQDRLNSRLDQMDSIDDKVAFLVERGNIPSLVGGIVVNDTLVWLEAFGEANTETTYLTGSIAKMFTATAVMQLYEEGLLDLDADINQYLPFAVRHPDYPERPITVRLLLTHQSGLNSLTIPQEIYFNDNTLINWLAEEQGWALQPIFPRPELTDYLAGMLTPGAPYYFAEVWTSHPPGTLHRYANTNYILLALLVESATGQSFPGYMEDHVFTPLEMNHTGYEVATAPQMAVGYEREFTLLSKTNLPVPPYENVPGPGGLISNVPDLSQFMIAQLNQGQAGSQQLLDGNSIDIMHNQATAGGGHINKVGYGLGFTHLASKPWEFYGNYYGLDGAIGHEGGHLGYAGSFYFVEKDPGGYGFILLTNENFVEKGVDYCWYFPVYYKINTLLMAEAAARYEQTLTISQR